MNKLIFFFLISLTKVGVGTTWKTFIFIILVQLFISLVISEPTKENSAIKVTKLRNLSEVHIFTPLMRAYEALLSDRTDLIDQYKQEGSKLRKMITSLEDENQALR